jgi:hypothetical protein
MLGDDDHAPPIHLDHIGQIVVALVAVPRVALLGQDPQRLASSRETLGGGSQVASFGAMFIGRFRCGQTKSGRKQAVLNPAAPQGPRYEGMC